MIATTTNEFGSQLRHLDLSLMTEPAEIVGVRQTASNEKTISRFVIEDQSVQFWLKVLLKKCPSAA